MTTDRVTLVGMCNFHTDWWRSRHSLGSSEKATSPSISRDLGSLNLRAELNCTHPPPQASPVLFPLFILLQFYQDSSMELWPLLWSSVTSFSATANCRESVKSFITDLKQFSLYLATKRCVFMPSELGGGREIDLLIHNRIPRDCAVYAFS